MSCSLRLSRPISIAVPPERAEHGDCVELEPSVPSDGGGILQVGRNRPLRRANVLERLQAPAGLRSFSRLGISARPDDRASAPSWTRSRRLSKIQEEEPET